MSFFSKLFHKEEKAEPKADTNVVELPCGKFFFAENAFFMKDLALSISVPLENLDIDLSADLYCSHDYAYLASEEMFSGAYGIIRGEMAEKFANVYVIDLYENAYNFYSKEWKENLWDSGHFNVIGYEYCASVMAQYIDWIIRNNYSDFKDANLIPFTEPE